MICNHNLSFYIYYERLIQSYESIYDLINSPKDRFDLQFEAHV